MLSGKINLPEVRQTALWAAGNADNLGRLWQMAQSADRRTAVNALWVMTHLPESEAGWLASLQDEMIDRLLAETDTAKRRLLLHLLREQEYDPENLRTDFLDFCLSKINSEHEPYAIRCFSIYAAFKMCRHYPELLAELSEHLDMMSLQPLSPGLKSALRQTKKKISRLYEKKS